MAEMYQDSISSINWPVDDEDSSCCRRLWQRAFPLGFQDEFKTLWQLAWPAILTTFFQFFLQTTSIIMCGQQSKADLDAVSLAASIINVAGICIGVGMSTACDTLFSQTFGSRNKLKVGMYLQRSMMIMYCTLILLCCLHLNIRPVLLWLQQEPHIAERAAKYILYFMPGMFFDFSFLIASRYLQNQNIMYPPMVAGFIGNVFNAVSQYIALHVLHYDYLSSAVLQAASLAVMFCTVMLYILISGVYKDSWDGWKAEALCDWLGFLKLAIPGIFLIALEEWSFEVATVLAGTLGDVQLGAQSILFQLESISYMIPFGMSVAVNIRVGQQLGGRQPEGAAQSFRVGLVMIGATAVAMCFIFGFLRNQLPLIFTKDKEIVSTAGKIIPILGIFQIADGLAAISSGAIRGCGRQLQGALLLFLGYYVLGLPVGIPLALLTDLKVLGIWLGLVIGMVIEAGAFCCVVLRLDWHKEMSKAQLRAYGPSKEAEKTVDSAGEDSQCPSDVESECARLLSNSHDYEVAFYSDPESSSSPIQRRKRRRRGRRRQENLLYTGRFYSRSVSLLMRDDDADDSDTGSSEMQSMKTVVAKRVAAVLLVLLAACGAVLLRICTDSWLQLPDGNSTIANATELAR